MGITHVLKTRVTPETKARVAVVTQEQLLTESIWLRRLVLKELRATALQSEPRHGDVSVAREECSKQRALGTGLYVRLQPEDRLLLHERAAVRGMASATYASVLLRAHLRSLAPLPKDELVALKHAISELGAVGRNLNQIARAVNQGARLGSLGPEDLRAILKVCVALRDHTKGLLKSNAASWNSGHAEPSD